MPVFTLIQGALAQVGFTTPSQCLHLAEHLWVGWGRQRQSGQPGRRDHQRRQWQRRLGQPWYPFAAAVWQASLELGVSIRWGGVWLNMADIKTGTPSSMNAAFDAYGAARRKLGKAAFPDGPHLELAHERRPLLSPLHPRLLSSTG